MSFFLILLWSVFVSTYSWAEFPPESTPVPEQERKAGEPEVDYLAPLKRRQAPPPPAEKKPIRPTREAVQKQPLEDEPPPSQSPSRKNTVKRFHVQGGLGYNSLHSNNSANETILATAFLTDSFAINGSASYRLNSNFGAELELSYAFTPNQTLVYDDAHEETRQIKQLSFIAAARAEYPVAVGKMLWRPRFLLGWGSVSETQTSGRVAGTSIETIGIGGLCFGLGLNWEWDRRLNLFADATFSLGASGSYSRIGPTTGNSNLNGPSYNRLRLGGLFKVYDPISVGAQIAYRVSSGNGPAENEFLLGQRDSSFQALFIVSADF